MTPNTSHPETSPDGRQNDYNAPERCYTELERRFHELEQRYERLLTQCNALVKSNQELKNMLIQLCALLKDSEKLPSDGPTRAEFEKLAERVERVSSLLTPIARSLMPPSVDSS